MNRLTAIYDIQKKYWNNDIELVYAMIVEDGNTHGQCPLCFMNQDTLLQDLSLSFTCSCDRFQELEEDYLKFKSWHP